jgi:hypothetical protein
MYCPQCNVEYREGFTECSDCQVPLLSGSPPEPPPGDPNLDLVPVFESTDRFAIGLAKGSLEDAGIPFWTEDGETAARLVLDSIVFPLCRFLVPKDREAEARELLAPLESPQEDVPRG